MWYYGIDPIDPNSANYQKSSAQFTALKQRFEKEEKALKGVKKVNIRARKDVNNTDEAKMHQLMVKRMNIKHSRAMEHVNNAGKGVDAKEVNTFYNKVLRYRKRDPMRQAVMRKALNTDHPDFSPNKAWKEMNNKSQKDTDNYHRGSLYRTMTKRLGFPKNKATTDKIMNMTEEQAKALHDLTKEKGFDKRGLSGAVVRDIFMNMESGKNGSDVNNMADNINALLEGVKLSERQQKKLVKYSPRGELKETLQTYKDMKTSYGFGDDKMMKLHRRARTVGKKLPPKELFKARSKVRAKIDKEFMSAVKSFVGDNPDLIEQIETHPHKKALTDKIVELGNSGNPLTDNEIESIRVALADGISYEKKNNNLQSNASKNGHPQHPPQQTSQQQAASLSISPPRPDANDSASPKPSAPPL